MIENLLNHKEIVSMLIALGGVMFSFLAKFVMDWRHKINFEYVQKKDVSITLLKDKIAECTIAYIENVLNEKDKSGLTTLEIFKKVTPNIIATHLSDNGNKLNNIKTLYNRLTSLISLSLKLCLSMLGVITTTIFLIGLNFLNNTVLGILVIFLIFSALVLYLMIGALFIYDEKFFSLVNQIIEPEL